VDSPDPLTGHSYRLHTLHDFVGTRGLTFIQYIPLPSTHPSDNLSSSVYNLMRRPPIHLLPPAYGARRSPHIYPANRIRWVGRPRRILCYKKSSIDSGLWCWDATTQAASDDAPFQRRGWRGVLSFSFEVGMRQRRVTLPCKSLQGVRAPNSLHPSFPSLSTYRAPDSSRAITRGLSSVYLPLHWKTPRRVPPMRTHLPVDAVAHRTRPFTLGLSRIPLINSHLVCLTPALPPPSLMDNTYSPLKKRIREKLREEWASLFPTPGYYLHPPALSSRPFMGLGKFVAGRIHQMRAGKAIWPPTRPGGLPTPTPPAPAAVWSLKPSRTPSYPARRDNITGRASSMASVKSVPKPHFGHPSHY